MLLPPTASRTTKHLVIMSLEVEQMVPYLCVQPTGLDSEKWKEARIFLGRYLESPI